MKLMKHEVNNQIQQSEDLINILIK